MTVLAFHNAVLDSDLPMGVKMALIAIDRHRNAEGESVWPSIERLCQLSSSKKTAFMGYLKVAEEFGWLTRERRFNRSNVFDLRIPVTPQPLPDTANPTVQNLNHQTVDGSESEPLIVRNTDIEVTKEVTNNLEVTKVIVAREESDHLAAPQNGGSVVTAEMRETARAYKWPGAMLDGFERWYPGVAAHRPNPMAALRFFSNSADGRRLIDAARRA